MFRFPLLLFPLSVFSFPLSGCDTLPPIELNNVQAEETQTLAKNPALADYLEQRSVPQDAHFHFSLSASRVHDRTTDAPVGWRFDLSVRCGLPLHELPSIKRAIRVDQSSIHQLPDRSKDGPATQLRRSDEGHAATR